MTSRIDTERTLRERALALSLAEQRIVLAYLASAATRQLESAVEFAVSISDPAGEAEAAAAATETAAVPPPAGQDAQAGDLDNAVLDMLVAKDAVTRAQASMEAVLAGRQDGHRHLAVVPPRPYHTPYTAASAAAVAEGTVTAYLACGDTMAADPPPPPCTEVQCPRHGSTVVITFGEWIGQHPPGLAAYERAQADPGVTQP